MESFTDASGQEIPLSEIKDVLGLNTGARNAGPFTPDTQGPYCFRIKLVDGTILDSPEYADMQSAADAKHELEVALREGRH